MGAFRKLATLLFVLCIPIALVTTNFRFLVNEPRVYEYAIDQYDVVRKTGVDRDQMLGVTAQLRDYWSNGADTVQVQVLRDGREVSLFNARETVHLKDIKVRFQFMDRLQEFSVIYAIAYMALVVLWSREVSLRGLALSVMVGCALSLAVIGGVGAVSMAGFDGAWLRFHEIVFWSNDFWLLNPNTDHLYQLFPPEFMQSIIFFAGLLIASQAALILIAAGIYLGVSGREQESHRLEPQYT